MSYQSRLFYILATLMLTILGCSSNSSISDGSEAGNPIVIGITKFDSGELADSTTVKFIPIGYNPLVDDSSDIIKVISNSIGEYFVELPRDSFNVIVEREKLATFSGALDLFSVDTLVKIDTLRERGAAKLYTGGDSGGVLFFVGTDIEISSNGGIELIGDLPSGTLPSLYHKNDNNESKLIKDSLVIMPNDTTYEHRALMIGSKSRDQIVSSNKVVIDSLELFGLNTIEYIEDRYFRIEDTIGYDLVIVAPVTTTPSSEFALLKKFKNPIILFESFLVSALGMATGNGGKTPDDRSSLHIESESHPVAAGLSGYVPIYVNQGAVEWNVPVGDVTTIATVDGKGVIFLYDKGDAIESINAPDKRVNFLVDGTQIENLTDDWWRMLRAGVEWAIE